MPSPTPALSLTQHSRQCHLVSFPRLYLRTGKSAPSYVSCSYPSRFAPKKRVQLAEALDTWSTDPASFATDLVRVEEIVAASHGYRWHAETTRNHQDRVLREYRKFTILALVQQNDPALQELVLDNTASEDVNDHILFPQNADKIVKYASQYLTMCSLHIQAQKIGKKTIRVGTILARRSALLYWLRRKCGQILNHNTLWLKTTEAIQYLHANVRSFDLTKRERIYMRRDEVVDLIDRDMATTSCIVNAEQHHLAWLIGLVCGIRPSSVAPLLWRDIKIYRRIEGNRTAGDFVVQIHFRMLKGNQCLPATSKAVKSYADLCIKARSPSQLEDLGLSIPHRLLVILLRRGLLKYHATAESLLGGDEALVIIKDTSLEHPVFLRASGRGLSINNNNIPMAKTAFTSYLSRRAQWAGYLAGCCMYSWRSKAATNVKQASGIEKARRFLAHGAQTNTLEEHYDQELYDFDATGIALGGQEERSVELGNFDAVALYRAELIKNNAHREAAIQNAVRQHPDVIAAAKISAKELKTTKQRVRNAAIKACLEAERNAQRDELTEDDIRVRQAKLHEPSALFECSKVRGTKQYQ